MWTRILVVVVVAGAAFWLGRQSVPVVGPAEPAADLTPHELHERRIRSSGLDSAALGRLWIRSAVRSLGEAPAVSLPFEESGYLDPERAEAVAYRFPARVGQRLRVTLEVEPPSNARFFLDLFRAAEGAGGSPARRSSAGHGEAALAFEPDRDGTFLVRVQPELLRGGRYTLRVVAEPTLAFPVPGAGMPGVRSFFGDPRDGGSRDHHGIDIFATRGTPVVAAVAGEVRSVRTTPIGGRVVWLRDAERRQSLYYAHLDEQLVERGQRVRPGDTLGLIGNSGNARTTPPHLHFGIYRRGLGPVDPVPFVDAGARELPAPFLPRPAAGGVRRMAETVVLRPSPDEDTPPLGTVEADTPVRVLGITGPWLRVAIDDGRRGFVPGDRTAPGAPLATRTVDAATPLRDRPGPSGVEVARMEAGARLEVVGRMSGHLYVRVPGRDGWIRAESTAAAAPSL